MGKTVLTKYETNVKPRFDEIKQWLEDGLTDQEIADRLGIHVWTIYDYKKKHKKFNKLMTRPSLWETNIAPRLKEIKQWYESGATDQEVYNKLNVSHDYYYKAIKEHPTLAELVKIGKEITDLKVINALLKSALGFEYEEVRTVVEEKNGKKHTRVEKIKKYQPPNPTAMIFWLKNRSPEQWNDRRELILDTKDNEEKRKQLFMDMVKAEVVDSESEGAEDERKALNEGIKE